MLPGGGRIHPIRPAGAVQRPKAIPEDIWICPAKKISRQADELRLLRQLYHLRCQSLCVGRSEHKAQGRQQQHTATKATINPYPRGRAEVAWRPISSRPVSAVRGSSTTGIVVIVIH